MKTSSNLLAFAFIIFLSACQETPDSEKELEMLEARHLDTPRFSIASHIGTPNGLTPIARNEMPYPIIYAQFADAIATNGEWSTVSEKVLDLKDQIAGTEPDIAFFFLEQMAAVHIVGKAAFDSMFVEEYIWSDPQIELLSSQVDILIKNRNPQSPLIAPALQKLQGHWPDARIREAAFIAADASLDWIERDKRSEMPEGMQPMLEMFFYRHYTDSAEEIRTFGKLLTVSN